MIESGDAIVVALYENYNQVIMPNMRLNQREIADLLQYLNRETLNVLARFKTDSKLARVKSYLP